MEDPLEYQLVESLMWSPDLAFPRQRQVTERLVSELFGGQQQSKSQMPDIVIARPDDMPVGIEVKLVSTSSFGKLAENRISELLASAVEVRRAFRGEIALAAMLLFREDPSSLAMADAPTPNFPTGFLSRLLRGNDGIGYDSVVVANRVAHDVSRKELRWRWFEGSFPIGRPSEASTYSTAETVAHVRQLTTQTERAPVSRPTGDKRRVLLVADEWRSGRGGISTVNRELAIALAAASVDATVMVPEASEEDVKSASDANVSLVTPARIPGLSDRELLLLRPVFADPEWEPEVIFGHGRLLGPFAVAQQQTFFKQARRVHLVHTDAEQLEAAKEVPGGPSRMSDAGERRVLERDLARSADLVAGVGPLLTEMINDELIGLSPQTRVICFIPGLRTGVDLSDGPSPIRNRILLIGRADDFQSKGIDIVAEALLRVADNWPVSRPHPPSLLIRGVPEDLAGGVKAKLDAIFENRVDYNLRPYSDSEDDLLQDLAQARVLVMPSRHEGFGLAAYEAIARGVPVLISAQSGLAQYLRSLELDTSPTSIVTTRNQASQLASDVWAEAIQRVLDSPDNARSEAVKLREAIAKVAGWETSVASILAEIDKL